MREDFNNSQGGGGGYAPEDDERDFQMEQAKKREKKSRTPVLDSFGSDLVDDAKKGKIDPVVGREEEIAQLIQILNKRKKNNPVLVGEPGVGKSAVVEGLALKIAARDIDESFFDKRVVKLELAAMVAGTKYRGMFEERMMAIMKEAKENPEIILFLDEIHTIVGAGGASGSLDAANMLKPPLAKGEFTCIGATTFDEYQKHFEKDKALARRFQKITVDAPTREETIEILRNIKKKYEEHHGVSYSLGLVDKMVDLSNRYMVDRNNPDKSIDLMDEVGSKIKLKNTPVFPEDIKKLREEAKVVKEKKEAARDTQDYELAADLKDEEKVLLEKIESREDEFRKENKKSDATKVSFDDVASIISKHTGIPITNLQEDDLDKMMKMEPSLKKNIIQQEKAIKKVCEAVQRSRTGIRDPKKPIGSFLFLGPTGVGKTEMVKQLAKFMFDDEEAIIKLDMSEYSDKFQVTKLFGAPPGYVGYEEGGQLTEKIRQKPYSIILFDEFEKAHEELRNTLLQILDEGTLTDGQGRKVDFKNTIIILTSNIGTSRIIEKKSIGFGGGSDLENPKAVESNVMNELKKHRSTSPEFLNRLDEIIVFNPLDKKSVRKIVDIQLKKIFNRLKKDKGLKIKVSDKVKDFLAEKGYDRSYGARPLSRCISENVENVLARGIMSKKIKDGSEVELDLKNQEVYIA